MAQKDRCCLDSSLITIVCQCWMTTQSKENKNVDGFFRAPMIQITYWGLVQYKSPTAMGAAAGLVAQSRALLLRNWRPERDFTFANNTAAGLGGYVFENYGADDGEGYSWTGSACPLYSWGGLTGFIGLQHAGFYAPHNDSTARSSEPLGQI
jgi:hypothetical protein